MMYNPFQILHDRLERIEELLAKLFPNNTSIATDHPEVGGLQLAQEITRLSKPRIYALVSARKIPHSKRGNKLYFKRTELLAWIENGSRAERQ